MKVEPLQIIQNPRRRAVLKVLRELGGEATLREVIWRVAKELDPPDVSSKLIKSIHISLLQTHLPKLRKAGLVEYDSFTDTIHLLNFPSEFKYYLEVVENKDISWSLYYLVISVVGLAASLFFGDVLSIILTSCFFVTAIIHANQTHRFVNVSLTRVKQKLTKYRKGRKPMIMERDYLVMSPQGECNNKEEK